MTKVSLPIDFAQTLGVRRLQDPAGRWFAVRPAGLIEQRPAAAVRLAVTAAPPGNRAPQTGSAGMARTCVQRRADGAAVFMIGRIPDGCDVGDRADEVRAGANEARAGEAGYPGTNRGTGRDLVARDTAAVCGERMPLAGAAGIIAT